MTSNHPGEDELEARVRERTAELEKANQALRAEIFELRQEKKVLRQSEQHTWLKPENLLPPALEVANLELAEIVNIQAIKSLMEDFHKLTHIPIGLNDLKGDVLACIGWQDICTKFHRVQPKAFKHCLESNMKLSLGVASGEFKLFRCKNNMWGISTPIMIGDQQAGILFAGQFFFEDEPLDYELFRSQAKMYGFNEEEYLEALEKVPRLSRETVDTAMVFLTKLANMISQLSYSNIKLAGSLAERDALMDALRESEELYRSIYENILDGILLTRPDGTILSANPQACRIFGMTEDEIIQTGREGIVVKDERLSAVLRERDMTGQIRAEMTHRRKDGSTFVAEVTSHLFTDSNGDIKTTVIFRDITGRKRMEEALREKEERFTAFMDNSPAIAWMKDEHGRHVYLNKSYENRFNMRLEDVWGKTDFEIWPLNIAEKFWENDRTVLKWGQTMEVVEETPNPEGGSTFWWNFKFPFQDASGKKYVGGIGIDITERKKAEEALRLSNLYNRSLIEVSLDPLVTIGPEGKITDVNGATEQVTGYSRNDLIGTDFSDYFTEPEKARAGYQQVFTDGKVRDYPLEIRHKDGHLTPVLYNASVYRDENGKVIGVFAAAREITERKRAEEMLAFERSQLLSIFDGIDDVVYVTDPYTFEVLYANKAMKETFGGELVGGICYREFQRRDSPCDFCTNPIILKEKGKPYHWEHYNPLVDRYFMIVDRIIKWPDGRDVRFEIAKDITERKKAEEALRLSNLYNRRLIEVSLDPLVTIGPEGKIMDVNEATEQVTGYSRCELIGTDFSDYFTEPEKARAGYKRVFTYGKVRDYPLEIRHKDGHLTPVLYNASVYRNENGEVIGVFAAARDITERKRAEHQLSNELARATGLCELYTRSSTLSDRELYDFALNQAVKITDSTIGFFHLVSEDEKEIILVTWNQEALRSCTAGKEGHYPIEKAGNWVDCVRLKRPVVYNDFPSSPNQKGLPAGHATVKRFMSVPVTENGKVRIIFGVGNKVDEYDDRDVMQLQLVANELHKIMKLRRIENEVRKSEAFLRDIMENVSDAIFVKDREARVILANTAYYRLMGKSPEEFLNKDVAGFHPPEVARKLAEDDKRVMETGKGTTLEERIFTSHGWRILQTVKAPYYDGQGNIIGLIGAARDITELKKAEDALKKAHDNLEKLVEERTKQLETAYNRLKESERGLAEAQRMAHIGNWSWDITTNELFWSDEVYRIFGLNPQELKVTYDLFLSYIHPEDMDHLINAIDEGLKGRPCDVDCRIILADGEERIVHIEAEVIFYEENISVKAKGIVQDITERKKAEEKIKILANALESSNDAIVTESLEGIITSWNRGAEQIYGYYAEEILGKDISILEPADLKGEIKQLIEKIKRGERVKHYETLRIKKDGTLINASVTLSPIFDASGELVAISAISRDITERIKAEKALAEIDKVRIKEIHHRIKNNLQVISSLLDLQAEKFRDKEVLEAFRESQNRILSMSLIHEELYKGGGTDKVDFSAYLRRLAGNLFNTYNLGSKNIRLYLALEENAFFDMDTAVPLGIIVNELVSNSLKHAFPGKEGDIRVRLCREEANPEISKSFFSLTISDNGKGIPENIELERVESLGLQLVNILVDQLDGNIELVRGQGTEFRITFNVAERP